MILSDADRAAIASEHLLSQTYDPGNPAAHPDGYIRYCRACWPRKCYAKLLDAALSDAKAERDAARADAERLAEALEAHTQVNDETTEHLWRTHVTEAPCDLCRALALHRERRPAEQTTEAATDV